jgi:hypothetical protein
MLIMWSFVGREKPEALVNNPKMTLNTPLLRRLRRFAFRPRIFMSRHHGCSRPSTPTSDALERGQSSVTCYIARHAHQDSEQASAFRKNACAAAMPQSWRSRKFAELPIYRGGPSGENLSF